MVLVLDDGSRLEMRSVPRFREVEAYIEERRQARRGGGTGQARSASPASGGFGEPQRQSA
jgi:hypothetical protein